jgi:PLP dependent protein
MESDLAANLREVERQIADACTAAGRHRDAITLIAVTKTHPAAVIVEAAKIGMTDIGESRVQEAEEKFAQIGHVGKYHLVGHLQANKVKRAVSLFDVIHSVDSLKLAEAICKRAGELNKAIDCLVEVNTSGESQKHGIDPADAPELIRQIFPLPHIRLVGLMTVGPLTDDQEQVRESFRMLKHLLFRGQDIVGPQFSDLSMGMSGDFGLAIQEGATMIRLGTILFGSREPQD